MKKTLCALTLSLLGAFSCQKACGGNSPEELKVMYEYTSRKTLVFPDGKSFQVIYGKQDRDKTWPMVAFEGRGENRECFYAEGTEQKEYCAGRPAFSMDGATQGSLSAALSYYNLLQYQLEREKNKPEQRE